MTMMSYLALCAETFIEDVPSSWEDIKGRSDEMEWKQAIEEEMTSLLESNT